MCPGPHCGSGCSTPRTLHGRVARRRHDQRRRGHWHTGGGKSPGKKVENPPRDEDCRIHPTGFFLIKDTAEDFWCIEQAAVVPGNSMLRGFSRLAGWGVLLRDQGVVLPWYTANVGSISCVPYEHARSDSGVQNQKYPLGTTGYDWKTNQPINQGWLEVSPKLPAMC